MTLLSVWKRPIEESSPAMAQHDAPLERSVESLPDSSPAACTARYLRTRTAPISDPQSVEPSSSIESELCAFDESVDRLEARTNEKTQDTLAVSSPGLSDDMEAQPADSDRWLDNSLARAPHDDEPDIQAPSDASPNRSQHSPTSRLAGMSEGANSRRRGALQLASACARLEEIATEALAWPWNAVSPDRFSHSMVADISRAWEETIVGEVEDTEPGADPVEASPNPTREPDIAKALEEAVSRDLEAASGDIELAPNVAPLDVSPDPTPESDITKLLEAFISRELENAFSRGLEGAGSGDMQGAPNVAPVEEAPKADSGSVHGRVQKRKLLAAGGIATVIAGAAAVAIIFLSIAPTSRATEASSGLQQWLADAVPVSSQSRSVLASNAGDDFAKREQSERLLQGFLQWRVKASSD